MRSRPEGPAVDRPGREAGNWKCINNERRRCDTGFWAGPSALVSGGPGKRRPRGRGYYCTGPAGLVSGQRKIAIKDVTELERAEGPAVNSHARQGVVRDINKIEGRRPGT